MSGYTCWITDVRIEVRELNVVVVGSSASEMDGCCGRIKMTITRT